jgi:hypothetical protein
LHNAPYAGQVTYNRQQFRKDPETGRASPASTIRATG